MHAYLSDPDLRLPRRLAVREIVRLVHEAHANRGGASIHACFGDLKGQAFFAVSLYPERTVQIKGKAIPSTLIEAFYRQNRDLFQDPRIILGTWYNADEDISYVDVTVVCIRRQEAVVLAEAYNQIAIFDLEQEVEIDVGGTGEERTTMPPETQRLPPLKREEE